MSLQGRRWPQAPLGGPSEPAPRSGAPAAPPRPPWRDACLPALPAAAGHGAGELHGAPVLQAARTELPKRPGRAASPRHVHAIDPSTAGLGASLPRANWLHSAVLHRWWGARRACTRPRSARRAARLLAVQGGSPARLQTSRSPVHVDPITAERSGGPSLPAKLGRRRRQRSSGGGPVRRGAGCAKHHALVVSHTHRRAQHAGNMAWVNCRPACTSQHYAAASKQPAEHQQQNATGPGQQQRWQLTPQCVKPCWCSSTSARVHAACQCACPVQGGAHAGGFVGMPPLLSAPDQTTQLQGCLRACGSTQHSPRKHYTDKGRPQSSMQMRLQRWRRRAGRGQAAAARHSRLRLQPAAAALLLTMQGGGSS